MNKSKVIQSARQVLNIEALAIKNLAKKLDNNFAEDAFDTSPKLKTYLKKELRYFLHFGKSFFLPP